MARSGFKFFVESAYAAGTDDEPFSRWEIGGSAGYQLSPRFYRSPVVINPHQSAFFAGVDNRGGDVDEVSVRVHQGADLTRGGSSRSHSAPAGSASFLQAKRSFCLRLRPAPAKRAAGECPRPPGLRRLRSPLRWPQQSSEAPDQARARRWPVSSRPSDRYGHCRV